MKIEGLESVQQASVSWEQDRRDETFVFEDIRLVADESFEMDFVVFDEDGRWRGLSTNARKQLFRELKIPGSYLSKCPRDLRQRQYDYWLSETKEEDARLWRSLGDNGPVLGILPAAYADVPYSAVIKALGEIEFEIPMKALSYERTPTHLKILLVGEERLVSLQSDRDLLPGIMIVTSDVGACSFIHSDFLFDTACSNGTVIGKEIGFHQTIPHKGAAIETVRKSLQAASRAFPSRLASIPKVVERAINRIVANGDKVVNRLRQFGVSKSLAEDIWNEAREEMKVRQVLSTRPVTASWWDVTSAMTRLARTQVPDPIARFKLEEAAGRILVSVN